MTEDGPRGTAALVALALIVVITAAWWALALWPLPPAAPEWLLRSRAACFGTTLDGLPDAGGWLLLTGQPAGMLAVLVMVWSDALRAGFRRVTGHAAGRGALAVTGALLFVGAGAATARVRGAGGAAFDPVAGAGSSADLPRLDRPPPPLRLVDQRGDTVSLAGLRGRPVLLTFAYGHCQTVCPLVVHDVLRARREAAGTDAVVVVVTVDPWRDTPARLAYLASAWELQPGDHLLSGPIPAVEATLDRWKVSRQRDPSTGEVAHPAGVYLIARDGRVAWLVPGTADLIGRYLDRL